MEKLTIPEIRMLRSIFHGKTTIMELVREHGMSRSNVSRLTSSLANKDFILKEQNGISTKIALTTNPFMEYLKQMLVKNMQIERILGGAGLTLYLTLIMPEMSRSNRNEEYLFMNISKLQYFSGLPRSTIYRFLKKGMYTGVIYKIKGQYCISPSMVSLKEFLKHYSLHLAASRVKLIANSSSIRHRSCTLLFICGSEFIFSIPINTSLGNSNPIYPTSITAFQQDDLIFFSGRDYYHYSPQRQILSKENHVVDNLLIDRLDARNVSYSLLYLRKNYSSIQRDYLLTLGRMFGLYDELISMLRYLEGADVKKFSQKKKSIINQFHLPGVKEFRDLCEMYGVKWS